MFLWCKDTLFAADMLYHMLLNYVSNVSNMHEQPHQPLPTSLPPLPLEGGGRGGRLLVRVRLFLKIPKKTLRKTRTI